MDVVRTQAGTMLRRYFALSEPTLGWVKQCPVNFSSCYLNWDRTVSGHRVCIGRLTDFEVGPLGLLDPGLENGFSTAKT